MKPIIEVNNLIKSYKKMKSKELIHAVNGVTFTVNKGEILGLLGPNGAGKTTTIKIVCGLLTPDSGSVTIKGINNSKNRLKALHHISAVLEGNRNLYWRLSVRENLEYYAGNRGDSRKKATNKINELLEKLNLKHKENELVNRLSRGMQQKLAIAVALLAETDVILLDEPTLGLDVETGYEVREILKTIVRDYNRTIIISSHDMDVIQELCDRTVIINQGKIMTDDRMDNLLKLFEVRAYEITLGSFLSNKQQQLLNQNFPHFEYIKDTFQSFLKIELVNSEEIYQLFDILKLEATIIEAINRKTINFEQIFMKIVKGGSESEILQSS